MLPIVIASLVFERTRSMWEIIPHQWKEEWEHHLELRILVLLSLTFQIVLIALGSRRKTTCHHLIRIVTWITYLSADAVAIFAIAVIRIEPSLKNRGGNKNAIDPTTQLRTFWASFLLMHLGGPDTITAYALEDNEFWLRHCLTLVSQAGLTLYILFLSWSGSYISWLYVLIFICGLLKYSERVFALWAASNEKFRDKMAPARHQRIPKMVEELELKEAEGHVVVTHQVKLHQVLSRYVSVHSDKSGPGAGDILVARRLLEIFQPAFSSQLLSLDAAHTGRSTLEHKPFQWVFNVIATELGFVYDLLFTKAILLQTRWGVAFRVVSSSLTTITLGVFSFVSLHIKNKASHQYYNKIDLDITLVLLVAAVFLELYALLVQHLLFSDRAICWLYNQKHSTMLSIINWLRPLPKRKRWSDKMGQFSLLSYSLKEKHYLCGYEIPKIQRYFYLSHDDVEDALKERLYDHIKMMPNPPYKDLRSLWDTKWKDTQHEKLLESFHWSIEQESLEFDMCVLIWHIATDICCHAPHYSWPSTNQDIPESHDDVEAMLKDGEVSLDLSRYMLHLLVMYPTSLPAEIGRIKFEDMHSMMTTFFKHHRTHRTKPTTNAKINSSKKKLNIYDRCKIITDGKKVDKKDIEQHAHHLKVSKPELTDACNLLLNQVNTQLNLTVSTSEKSKFVMFNGCQLASQLINEIEDAQFRFCLLRETWIGMLILAALKSGASYHLQQLRRGGELMTHVWLLLVHFGFTRHFKIPNTVEVAEMIIK